MAFDLQAQNSEERHPGRLHLILLPLCSLCEVRIKYILSSLRWVQGGTQYDVSWFRVMSAETGFCVEA